MTMPGYRTPAVAAPEPRGPGVTSLTLGVAGLLTFWMCGLGMLLAAAGLAAGGYAVVKGRGRALGYAGIAVSVLTLLIATGALVWFGKQAADCGRFTAPTERSACMEQKFPLLKARPAG